jgi:hypothetical protein
MLQALDAKKPDDVFFIRSRTSASYFKVKSVDPKPMTANEADEFAKREVRAEISRKDTQQITDAALANAKYEGEFARIMANPTAGAANPAPATGGRPTSGAAQTTQKPAGETEKEQPKH